MEQLQVTFTQFKVTRPICSSKSKLMFEPGDVALISSNRTSPFHSADFWQTRCNALRAPNRPRFCFLLFLFRRLTFSCVLSDRRVHRKSAASLHPSSDALRGYLIL